MQLTYYPKPNFGDAANPYIFNRLLPDFFDQDDQTIFLGIGSILGLYSGNEKTAKIIVFSSGYAYGELPNIDKRYDIRCIRGPLTAKALNISEKLIVTDGAALLSLLPESQKPVKKKYKFSIIPHHHSQSMFTGWDKALKDTGIHHINPKSDAPEVINQIRESEVILAEAMHAAIFADTLRVPWIPVKMFQHINSFKWRDWSLSMGLPYEPEKITSLFDTSWIKHIINSKFGFKTNNIITNSLSPAFRIYQQKRKMSNFYSEINRIKEKEPVLSKQQVLDSKVNQLAEILEKIKKDYHPVKRKTFPG